MALFSLGPVSPFGQPLLRPRVQNPRIWKQVNYSTTQSAANLRQF